MIKLKRYKRLFIEGTSYKFWITPDDSVEQVDNSETHEEYLYNYDETLEYNDALKLNWVRVLCANYITYFNCYNFSNKTYLRILKAIKQNRALKAYSSDVEIVDAKDKKRYRYYLSGNTLTPIK